MNEEQIYEEEETLELQSADSTEIRDTDIVFDCPHCGKSLVMDYRGVGLQVDCPACGTPVLVPIPDGMELRDLDLDAGEVLKQLFATRRNYQRVELKYSEIRGRLAQLQETLGVMQEVIAEGLCES